MRRSVLFLFLPVLVTSIILFATFAGAQDDDGGIVIPPATRDMDLIAGSTVHVEAVPISVADITSVSGADSCTAATTEFPFDYASGILNLGSATDVSAFTTASNDPSLSSCMAGSFSRGTGYRSAWFKVIAPIDGQMIVEAATNSDYKRNYDTVISIYSDTVGDNSCSSLTQLSCNDDTNGILSKVSTSVSYNQTYYILVVDRNAASSGQTLLDIDVTISNGSDGDGSDLGNPNGDWYVSPTILEEPISRHTVVVSGTDMYVLGGQTSLGNAPVRTGDLYRFDTTTETLTQLTKMPASAGFAGEGYSNADAMIVGNEIHYFSGYVGSPAQYDMEHWIYTIATDKWSTYAELYPTALTLSATVASNGATADFNQPLAYTALAPYETSTTSGFYVTGGLAGEFLSSNTPLTDTVAPNSRLFRYIAQNSGVSNPVWQELTGMNKARYAHTAATVISGTTTYVCVVGGLGISTSGVSNVVIEDGECYSPLTNTWDSTAVSALNNNRYMAHSAVSADGTWYVYGGIDENGVYVAEVEAFNISTGSWTVLGPNYNLDEPTLAWPRGGFTGSDLWVFGGEQNGNLAVGEIKAKTFPYTGTPSDFIYLPLLYNFNSGSSFDSALRIGLDTNHTDDFDGVGDVYNVYRFETVAAGTYTVTLTGQSTSADADFLIYNSGKNIVDIAQSIGSADESLPLAGLDANSTYYILVARSSPPPNLIHVGNFTLRITSP